MSFCMSSWYILSIYRRLTFKIVEMKVELELERHRNVVSPLDLREITALVMAGC